MREQVLDKNFLPTEEAKKTSDDELLNNLSANRLASLLQMRKSGFKNLVQGEAV
jgi:hypothetical protein